MAKEIQPKKKIMPISVENLEDGYLKAMTQKAQPIIEKVAEPIAPSPPIAEPVALQQVAIPKEHRLTIDISNEIFTLMDEHRKETGQSYKGLITYLLKQHFKK
jgi:hypothetical protein